MAEAHKRGPAKCVAWVDRMLVDHSVAVLKVPDRNVPALRVAVLRVRVLKVAALKGTDRRPIALGENALKRIAPGKVDSGKAAGIAPKQAVAMATDLKRVAKVAPALAPGWDALAWDVVLVAPAVQEWVVPAWAAQEEWVDPVWVALKVVALKELVPKDVVPAPKDVDLAVVELKGAALKLGTAKVAVMADVAKIRGRALLPKLTLKPKPSQPSRPTHLLRTLPPNNRQRTI